ncbi:MAG: TonB-dependent receptor [Bacteroidetes bacterium]|nr:TonB-dependent receptor [Bacteroidota bacterium]
MKKTITFLACLIISIGMTYGLGVVHGKIADKTSGNTLSGVNVRLLNTNKGASSDQDGNYKIELESGIQLIEFSYVGYENIIRTINIKDGNTIELNIQMISTVLSIDELVVTASRIPEYMTEIPGRIEVVSLKDIKATSAKSVDELLTQTSGVIVDRSLGIFSKSVVGIRGIAGGEQGRILVLQNGVPINKTDGGSVNWNRINVNDIQKIEIFKGPGSSIYGSNAMGGVINILTKKNTTKGVHGFVSTDYGTFNTFSQNISIGGKLKDGAKGLYWGLTANNRTSNGYISVPDSLIDETVIASGLKEKGITARIGYDLDEKNNVEIEYNYYDDERGRGEKIQTEQIREFDTHFLRGKWQGSKGVMKWDISSFYQFENYLDIREKFSKNKYSRWDVNSERKEMGALANVVADLYHHRLIFGTDFRNGSVDGADVYQTSTDIVRNIGSMDNFALYAQDKYSITEALKLTAGVRFDMINFHDGEFRIDGMTSETDFMAGFTGNLEEHNWSAFTPKAAVHYTINNQVNTYVAWSKGFRAPTLDDLCRSGLISGGFKLANPNLGPESVNSFEWGMNMNISQKLKMMSSIYFMKGQDFMYYLNTGDFVMGGKKPVLQKANITEVSLMGIDLDLKYQLNEKLNLYANYTFTKSKIKKFDEQPELEGKALTYTPKHMINTGFGYEDKIVNFSVNFHYQDKRYRDDSNTDVLKGYSTFDAKLWKEVKCVNIKWIKSWNFTLDVSNLMDKTYLVYSDQISIGRFITGGISISF